MYHKNSQLLAIIDAIKAAGGRALIVGGYVRDHLLNLNPKDIDLEVYNLSLDQLRQVLSKFGDVDMVGKAFGVFKLHGCDISIPRHDSKVAVGHKGFEVSFDPFMSFEDAARRRDFTINSMAMNALTDEIIDPYGGQNALKRGVLSMTDPKTFVEDPLRVLRGAQFISRFELVPDDSLLATSREIAHTMTELAGERVWEEMCKLLLKGKKPSKGLEFLKEVGVLSVLFPELQALISCPQEFEWHPEGDVWIHTMMAVDIAAELFRNGDLNHDLTVMFGTLCHDFGKPITTQFETGRWRAKGHEEAGVAPTTSFMDRMRAPLDLVKAVNGLVAHHLAPAHFVHPKFNATPKAYRNLARKLSEAGTTIDMLYKVSSSDHFGRTTSDAIARDFSIGEKFMAKAKEIQIVDKPEPDVVMGRHLITRGLKPGKEFGPILDKCREYQYETGNKNADEILRVVLDAI
jgi:tRNA nucleotidyltransferase (CCA-adding enzyme)